jgi:hypothetical protein
MLYLHVIDTNDISSTPKSLLIEKEDAFRLGQIISEEEVNNIIIINSINKDTKTVEIIHVFLNGNEDVEYSEVFGYRKK